MLFGCISKNIQESQIPPQLNNFKNLSLQMIDRSIVSLEAARTSSIVELANNSRFNLEAKIVAKQINGTAIRMYAYNGQIPGPRLKVKQGTTIYVNFTNNLDENTTLHSHGLRLKNQFDGVPDVTQDPIKPGESFVYQLEFPDEGIYWYHPHIREDVQQDLGMYGLIEVEPTDQSYYNLVDTEEYLVLDDILLLENNIYPYYKNFTNFALMGRYGNVMLVNGETNYSL
jgi:FtsP/CotA-like multicopper oxidase with cupredoxin domain